MILFIKLLLSHLIGDFILQPASWVREKATKKHRSWHLYFHGLIHGVLAMLVVWDIRFWLPALIIALSHLVIDIVRQHLSTGSSTLLFVVDQFLHIAVISGITFWWTGSSFSVSTLSGNNAIIYITAVVAVTLPAAIFVKTAIAPWCPHQSAECKNDSMQNAGMFIGILERLFVLIFIIAGRWEGIGFLIAAKSVFRFSDIKNNVDNKLTEYFLIGTLLSIGIALFAGLMVLYAQNLLSTV